MKLRRSILWRHRQCRGCKGGKSCCKGKTSIHKSAIESTTSHKGVDNGRSTTKGNGDGVA